MNAVRKHQPAPKKLLIGNIIDMGNSLDIACFNLATDPTIKNADKLLYRLEGAAAGVRQLRKALLSDGSQTER